MATISIEQGYDMSDIESAYPNALDAYKRLPKVLALIAFFGEEDLFASVSFTSLADEGAQEDGVLTSVVWEEKWTGDLLPHRWTGDAWVETSL